jgi:hypothetical protein
MQAEIEKSLISDEPCEYCKEIRSTFSMGELADRCAKVIEDFYELTSQSDVVVLYDRTPKGDPLATILEVWLATDDEQALIDLVDSVEEIWFDRDSMESSYGEDPWFIEKYGSSWELSADWEKMERSLRQEARLVNPLVTTILEKVLGPLIHDRTENGESLIFTAGVGHSLNTLYRARVFQTQAKLESALSSIDVVF